LCDKKFDREKAVNDHYDKEHPLSVIEKMTEVGYNTYQITKIRIEEETRLDTSIKRKKEQVANKKHKIAKHFQEEYCSDIKAKMEEAEQLDEELQFYNMILGVHKLDNEEPESLTDLEKLNDFTTLEELEYQRRIGD
jgi:hypothetical protein